MHAYQLTTDHVGHDLTFVYRGTRFGGIIGSVTHIGSMISVVIDGQDFVFDEEKWVELTYVDAGRRLLREPDPEARRLLYAEQDARGVFH